MTISEVIKREEEAAKDNEELYRVCPASESGLFHCDGNKDCKVLKNGENKGCRKCADEHMQIAEWLKELKLLKEQGPPVIPQPEMGQWIQNGDDHYYERRCSKCDFIAEIDEIKSWNYCPICGKKMQNV